MPASIDVSQSTQDQSKQSSEARLRISWGRYWLCAIFVLALAVRLWFAFADGHNSIVYSCDASEYLRDARGLAQLIETNKSAPIFQDALQSVLNRTTSEPQLRHGFEPVKELAIAGPIFPLFLLISHAVFGLPIAELNWQAPVLFQCILTSLTCVLIAWIGKSAWNRNVGITAGIIAACYPGFIVNSIRMYSESFSCFLLCAVVALTIPVVQKSGLFHSVSTGICLAFLQLTRSIMVLVTGLTFALTAWFSKGKSRALRLLGLVVGLAIVFAPWLLFQQMAFNKSSVVVDRVGHYNLFIGTNITTQGYLSYPYPDGNGIEKRNYASLVGAQIKESPERFLRLMLDKPLRLYKFPWNDFRTPIGPFGIDSQVLFHQLALAFAAIGLTLCLVDKSPTTGRGLQLRLTLATLWAMHCVYLLFITVPRYNLTSIPFVILFASAGVCAVIRAFVTKSDRSDLVLSKTPAAIACGAVLLAVICARVDWFGSIVAPLGGSPVVSLVVAGLTKATALLIFFAVLYKASNLIADNGKFVKTIAAAAALITIPLCALPLRSSGRIGETTARSVSSPKNERKSELSQTIYIPDSKRSTLSGRDCYVLIDCENWQTIGTDAEINVNGVKLDTPPVPIMPFAQTLSATKARAQKPLSQQRYLECEDIYSSLTAASGGGNLDLRQWFAIAIPGAVIDSTLASNKPQLQISVTATQSASNKIYAAYADRNDNSVRIPSVARYSWEKAFYGVENESGFTDSRYDDKVIIAPGTSSDTSVSNITPNIRLLIGPPMRSEKRPAVAFAGGQANKVVLSNNEIPPYDTNTLWLASVKGKISSSKTGAENIPISFSMIFESHDAQGVRYRYRSPWVPTSVVSQAGTTSFEFAAPFQPVALPGTLTSISVEPTAGGPAEHNNFLSVHNQARTGLPAGAIGVDHRIELLELRLQDLQSNPIGNGHEVL